MADEYSDCTCSNTFSLATATSSDANRRVAAHQESRQIYRRIHSMVVDLADSRIYRVDRLQRCRSHLSGQSFSWRSEDVAHLQPSDDLLNIWRGRASLWLPRTEDKSAIQCMRYATRFTDTILQEIQASWRDSSYRFERRFRTIPSKEYEDSSQQRQVALTSISCSRENLRLRCSYRKYRFVDTTRRAVEDNTVWRPHARSMDGKFGGSSNTTDDQAHSDIGTVLH